MQAALAGQPLDGADLAAVALDRQRQARQNTITLEQYRAGTASALVTALLRAGEPEMVTQEVQQ